ncbi:MAG: serine/threonine-protein kinase [Planctomycetaceae bacterium]
MTAPTSPPEPEAGQSDNQLAVVLEKLLEARRRGEEPDIAAEARRHPEIGDELQSLWTAAILAEELGPQSIELDGIATLAVPAAPLSPSTSTTLPRRFGEYELQEELGRGGMGVVYRARQTKLGRDVALKLILRAGMASPVDLARFRAEAESAAQLDHPNIVPVFEVGDVDDQPYFSMKHIEGTTLARRLADGPLDARVAAAMLTPIARAIAEAHRGGVLHRDLKPSNILLDAEGRPFVTDFGLAKRVETGATMTQTGAIVGTPSYMAPEQAAGNRGSISPATDVYGLGAVLYHMLTGRPVFQAATPVDTLFLVLEQEPLPPRLLNRQIDPDLEMIALRCLEKSPSMRYSSADALADDLDAYLASEPISARTTSLAHWFGRMLRETHHAPLLEQWGLLWMLHSAVVLIMCVLTAWLNWREFRSPLPYLGIWTIGLGLWGALFWSLRRRGGPITFVERQIAHVWAAGVISSTLLFLVEVVLGLPVLTLSPVLAIVGGVAFLVKAAILSGTFYVQAAANFLCALAMARWPSVGLLLFGVVNSLSFFIPGWKYFQQRRAAQRTLA